MNDDLCQVSGMVITVHHVTAGHTVCCIGGHNPSGLMYT